MVVRIVLFLCLGLLLCSNFVFAGEMIASQAYEHFNEGVREQAKGNVIAAETAYNRAMLMDPNNPEYRKFVLNNMGVVYAQQGDFDQAAAAFRQVLEMDPAYKPAQLNLGLVYDLKMDRLSSLEYWAAIFKLEALKPKDFTLSGEVASKPKKE